MVNDAGFPPVRELPTDDVTGVGHSREPLRDALDALGDLLEPKLRFGVEERRARGVLGTHRIETIDERFVAPVPGAPIALCKFGGEHGDTLPAARRCLARAGVGDYAMLPRPKTRR